MGRTLRSFAEASNPNAASLLVDDQDTRLPPLLHEMIQLITDAAHASRVTHPGRVADLARPLSSAAIASRLAVWMKAVETYLRSIYPNLST
jgi:hypothetical protein